MKFNPIKLVANYNKKKKEKKQQKEKNKVQKQLFSDFVIALSNVNARAILLCCEKIKTYVQDDSNKLNEVFSENLLFRDIYEAVNNINVSYQVGSPFNLKEEYEKIRPYLIDNIVKNDPKNRFLLIIIFAKWDEADPKASKELDGLITEDKALYEEVYPVFRRFLLETITLKESSERLRAFSDLIENLELLPQGEQRLKEKLITDKSLVKDIYTKLRPLMFIACNDDQIDTSQAAHAILKDLTEIIPNLDKEIDGLITKDNELKKMLKQGETEKNRLLENVSIQSSEMKVALVKDYISKRESRPEYYERFGCLKITFFGRKFGHSRTMKLDTAKALLDYLNHPEDQQASAIMMLNKEALTSGELGDIYKTCLK